MGSRIRREKSKKHVAKGTDASVDLNIMTMTRYQARSMIAVTFFLSFSTQLHCMIIQLYICVPVVHMHNTSSVSRFITSCFLWLFKKELGNLASLSSMHNGSAQ